MATKSTQIYGLFIMSSLFLIIGSETTPIGRNRGARGNDNRGPQGRVGPNQRQESRRRENYSNQDSNDNIVNKYRVTTESQCQEYLCKYGYLLTCNCARTLARYKRQNTRFIIPSEHIPNSNDNELNLNFQQDNNLPSCEPDDFAKAYRDFQINYHLPLTSVCDYQTKDIMSVRRCGQPDIIGNATEWNTNMHIRSRRETGSVSDIAGLQIANQTKTQFILKMQEEEFIRDYESRPPIIPLQETEEERIEREKRSILSITVQDSTGFLTKMRVTWRLMNSHEYVNPQWSRAVQISVLKQAFKYWSEISPICFVMDERSAQVDISVGFLEGRHLNCFKRFDGPGREVAHKWYRDVHFDKTEQYLKEEPRSRPNRNSNAISLKLVAVHEIGHVLGLNHSSGRDSVMNALYRWQLDGGDFSLNAGDRQVIRRVYGECTGSFDAVFDFISNGANPPARKFSTYFFRKNNAWAYVNKHQKPETGHPLPISSMWNGVPSNIDTFMQISLRRNRKYVDSYYFFKGDRYYKFDATRDTVVGRGRINSIFKSGRQHSIPSHLDAAYFEWIDEKCHFFKGEWVYTYDCSRDPADTTCCVEKARIVDIFPPKATRELAAPDGTNYRTNIDAVYHSFKTFKLYIFKGEHVWVAENYNIRTQTKNYYMKYVGLWNEHWHYICESECT